jgi:hypothetical protein
MEEKENGVHSAKCAGWDRWKLLTVANTLILAGFAITHCIAIDNMTQQLEETKSMLVKHESTLTDLIFSDTYYEPKGFDLSVGHLQSVNNHLSVALIKAEPHEEGQKLTLGVLNTSGATMNNVKLRVTMGNETEGIDANVIDQIPAGWMPLTTVVLPKEYVGQNLLLGYLK